MRTVRSSGVDRTTYAATAKTVVEKGFGFAEAVNDTSDSTLGHALRPKSPWQPPWLSPKIKILAWLSYEAGGADPLMRSSSITSMKM
jgi:hypothetical protein